jgi:hypothetical protein
MKELTTELADLLEAMCLGELSPTEASRLEAMALADDEFCRHYIRFMYMNALAERAKATSSREERPLPESSIPDAVAVPYVASVSPIQVVGAPVDGPVGYITGWPVAYLVATVILGIGLAIAAVTRVSQPIQIVDVHLPVSGGHHEVVEAGGESNLLPSPSGRGAGGEGGEHLDSSLHSAVGQITGMVDCQWLENPKPDIRNPKSPIHLGDRLALRSGLMEISYDSGAKVILQGPVTYRVESSAGGYLSVGRLTARVEDAKSQDPRSKTKDQNPKSPNLQVSKFVVRTPHAVVTDLGTEFGVEVDKSGETTSHVFRGAIRVQSVAASGQTRDDGRILRENESVRIERQDGRQAIVLLSSPRTADFVRSLPKRSLKVLDLADVVAGGDGFSGRRDHGIDPTGGQPAAQPRYAHMRGDYQYHRVEGLPLIDGVFIPDGGLGPVQVDSAGHRFDGFRKTANIGFGYVWVGSGKVGFGETTLGGIDYALPPHVAILMHANKGITFDLDAIRRANPGHNLSRFRATAGSTERASLEGKRSYYSHIMVLVDGQLRFRREVEGTHGAYAVAVPVRRNDRFLTLVASDAGDGYYFDQILFGDPVLEMTAEAERPLAPNKKDQPR